MKARKKERKKAKKKRKRRKKKKKERKKERLTVSWHRQEQLSHNRILSLENIIPEEFYSSLTSQLARKTERKKREIQIDG